MDGRAGVVLVTPGVEEVVVGDGDDESDQQGLGDAAVGEPVVGIAEVEVVSLESAIEALGHGTNTFVGGDPGGAEVGQILAELVEVAEVVEVAGAQDDGVLVADFRQFAGLQVGLWGQGAGVGGRVSGSLPGVGQVDCGAPTGAALVEAVEAGAGQQWEVPAELGHPSVTWLTRGAPNPPSGVCPVPALGFVSLCERRHRVRSETGGPR